MKSSAAHATSIAKPARAGELISFKRRTLAPSGPGYWDRFEQLPILPDLGHLGCSFLPISQ